MEEVGWQEEDFGRLDPNRLNSLLTTSWFTQKNIVLVRKADTECIYVDSPMDTIWYLMANH